MNDILSLPLVFTFTAITLIWLLILTILVWKEISNYRKLTKNITGRDLSRILGEYVKISEKNNNKIKEIFEHLEKSDRHALLAFKKIGFFRFNPFEETGGDQSFVLSLLDGHNNGFVISSLHGRNGTRLYAKPIENGKGANYELSAEEKRAVEMAVKQG